MDSLQVVTLSNSKGLELQISNFRPTIIGLKIQDRNRKLTNVVVGLVSVAPNYEAIKALKFGTLRIA